MIRKHLQLVTGLLALQGVVVLSAEYLRERQEKLQDSNAGHLPLDSDLLRSRDDSGRELYTRRAEALGIDSVEAYDGLIADWEGFLADQFLSIPTAAPTRTRSTMRPSKSPRTPRPTSSPTTAPVSTAPISVPTSTTQPVLAPVRPPQPSIAPHTVQPTFAPVTFFPTAAPQTTRPTTVPSPTSPTTPRPTMAPTITPVSAPSGVPVESPSLVPILPTTSPTTSPSASPVLPTVSPTASPSASPVLPTASPTASPSASPVLPTASPTASPSTSPVLPTVAPFVSPTAAPTQERNTLLDLIESTPRYSIFAEALESAGLSTTVETESLTVFVPNDSAMDDDYVTTTLIPIPNYQLHLKSLVRNHLTSQGVYTTANLTNGLQLAMLGNEQTIVNVAGNGQTSLSTFATRLGFTEPIPLQETDVIASNGVLHETVNILYPAWSFLDLLELLDLLETRFSTLINLLDISGLSQALQNAQNISLIAPTNEAFEALPAEVLQRLSNPANSDLLAEILLYHVITDVVNFEILPTGNTLFASAQGEEVTVGRRQRPNGAIDLFFNENRSPLFYLTRLNILYQVDQVLLPPSFGGTLPPTSAPAPAPAPIAPPTPGTLASLLQADPNYSTLVSLLSAGDLLTTLDQSNSGPFTFFAPTNDGFETLGAEYVDAISTEGYALHLSSFLLNHVLNGRITRAQLTNDRILQMANGLSITVSNDGSSVQLITSSVDLGETSAISVIPPERNAQNGILHQVDSVILPFWFFSNPLDALNAFPDTFSTLSSLILQAQMSSEFSGLVTRTIVAPNNAAFENLPPATLNFLADPANISILSNVLAYHVIVDLLPFPTLDVGTFNAATLSGEDIVLTVTETTAGGRLLSFNGVSGVGQGFYLTKDNLIYEVGGVLIPPSLRDVIPS